MIPLVLVAAVAAGGELNTSTLAGVTLGSNLTRVLSEYPGAQRSANPGQRWVWSRRGGGTVTVTADDVGNITRVDFVANKGQDNSIDLPCVGAFPVQDSHLNLELALNKTACGAFNGATYGLPDRSVVAVRFNGPDDGQLIEATWYRPSDKNPSPVGHMRAVIDYLRPAVQYVGGTARIYYAGECEAPERDSTSGFWRLLFPAVYLQPPRQGATGIAAVRQIFRDDPNVAVMQDRSGMLRITIGSVSTVTLQTKIPSLTLDPAERYTALSAIDKIAITADLYAKERGLPFGLAPFVIDHLVSGPIAGAPHLPKLMQNVTVDEALDAVVRTFKGIVTSGICKQPDGKSLFKFGFEHGS
jgi:hypothetical protein